MFKELIYKGNKVFSSPLKRSETVEVLLNEVRQKEDLSTAILLLEMGERTNALFILENKLYALYCLDARYVTPLLFSDFFKEASQCEAQVTLYQISPILFKSLLILAQYSPSVVGTPAVINVERILGEINKQTQEAVLLFKQDSQVQLFYFLNGDVRDVYFGGETEISTSSDLKKQILSASTESKTLRIELFDQTQISAANDCEHAEQIIANAQISPAPKREEDSTNKMAYVQAPAPEGEDADQKVLEQTKSEVKKKGKKGKKSDTAQTSKDTDKAPLWVKVLDGSRAGFLIRFSPEPVSLGRGKVSVRLNDPQVSRFHAELAWGKDGLFIRDNHSTNGIFVNDKKIYHKTLSLNDVIRLGDVRLKVVVGS